jgi:excinuclease ABC subunit C
LRTDLTEIEGIGQRTAQKLLQKFGSVARLKALSIEDLAAELPKGQAERVWAALHGSASATGESGATRTG